MIQVTLTLSVEQLAALSAFLSGDAVTEVKATVTAGKVEEPTPEPEKPKRTRRAAKKTAAQEPEPEPEPEASTLSYETDVKPTLLRLASNKNGGREAAMQLVTSYGVKNGAEIPAEKLPEVLEKAAALLEELNTETNDEFEI